MEKTLNSVCLVTVLPTEKQNLSSLLTSYGTGFFVHNDGIYSYVVTCAHVVKDAYEEKQSHQILIDGHMGIIEIYDEDTDISVVRVDFPRKISVLKLVSLAQEGERVEVVGMSSLSKHREKRDVIPLDGNLYRKTAWTVAGKEKISTWYLKLDNSDFKLQIGYSGSPVISKEEGHVVGIISHKVPDGYAGIAVSASALKRIWQRLPEGIFVSEVQVDEKRATRIGKHHVQGEISKYYQEEIDRKHKQLSKIGTKRDRLENVRITESSEKIKIDLDEEIEKCKESEKELFKQIEELAIKIGASPY